MLMCLKNFDLIFLRMKNKYSPVRRCILVATCLLYTWLVDVKTAAAAIGVGDIAVIGLNTDSPKDFTIVALAGIPSGETIYFTDKGISLGTWQTLFPTEGTFSLTTTSPIAAGTVIRFTITPHATSPTVTSSPSVGTLTVTEGWTSTGIGSPFGNNGDQMIVYQGSPASPVFIFGFHGSINITGLTNGWNTSVSGSTGNNYSEIPSGLTNGTNAVSHASAAVLDNLVYTGTRTGSKAVLLAAICNSANWTSNDATAFDLSPGGTQFPGTNPIFTIGTANSAPTDISLSASSVNENVSANTTVGALSSTDPNAGNTFTYSLVAGTGDTDNASFNINGSDLRITSSPDFETKSSYSVRIRTTDQGSLTYEEAFTITITNVNEAPTDIALSNSSVAENISVNTTVGALSSTDPDAGNTFTYTLVSGTGDTDNASFNISGGNLRITNSPDFEAKSSYSVRIRTTDQGSQTYEEAFTVTITNVNETPADIALSNSSVAENASANTTVGALSSTDPDAGNIFTYTLVSGTGDTDNASFNISGSNLRITSSPDFETKSSYSVRIRTTDQGSLTYEEAFTITVTNVNETPTDIALSNSTVAENVSANTTVGALSSTDSDAGNTFTYTLVSGTGDTDNASFNISGSNLRITSSPDFETKSSYSVRIRTTDQGSLAYEEAFTITITNANEAPTDIALSNSSVAENVSGNTTVGALSSTDPDTGNTFTYTLVAGTGDTDNASFNISGSNLRITNSPDFEAKSSYSVRVRTTDQGSLTYEETFMITISNANETPTDIALSNSSVAENVSTNTTVGALSATDSDAGNTFTYTLVAGTGDTDNASFNISGSNLRITNSPDFETKSSYSVRVRTTDQGSLTYEKAFTITITNVNETPADIALSASSIDEGVPANSTVGTLNTTDPDAGNTFTYTLVVGAGDTDNASFNISGSNLRITNSPDFETKSSYSVRIRTTDQGSLTYEEAFTITITDLLTEAPTDIALSNSTVAENVSANTTVGTLSSTDQDVGSTFTYTLVSGTGDADNAAFNINGSDLRITSSPDFETKSSYTIRIRTADPGNLTYEEAFIITVTNVNETPVDIALSASSVPENVAANTTVGTLSTADPDAGNTFTYTLAAGAGDTDNASFNVSGSTLRITNIPDFETKNSYTVRIRTTDQGSLTYEEAFTVTITNVNETPADIALSNSSIAENVSANTTIGTLSSTDPDAGNTFTYALVSGTGDTDNAAFNISGSNLRITSSPDFETKNSYTVRVRTIDQGSLTYEEAFTITVTNVSEAPTDIVLSASSIAENSAADATVGALSSTDPDAANTFTYSLVTGTGDTDNAAFTINGSDLRITSSPDFEIKNSYTVRIRTTDQGSLSYEKAFTVTITNVNETPTDIALSNSSIAENVSANATVGALSSTDPDAGGTFTYTLVSGTGDTDNASFNISGSNLRITNSPDFEARGSYSVRIRTTDQGGLTYEEAFTITVTNVNEAPADIALSNSSIAENVAANTTVGTLSATDPDAGGTFTYTLVSGAGDTDNASFTISGTSLGITNSPDFETKGSYTVRIRATDQGSLTYEEAFTIAITDENEMPADIALSASSVAENVAENTSVGTLSTEDPDVGNTFAYTLTTGTGDTDNAAFSISGNSLQITSSPDFETKSTYSVRIRTTDQGDLTYEEAFTITITDVNEMPTDIALLASSVDENVADNTTIGTLSSTDPDAENTFTYTLTAGTGDTDNAAFGISGNSLVITNSPDFETKSTYSVRIRTTDQGNLTYEEAFTIDITNVNETPTDITLSATSIGEAVAANATVGTLSTADPDAADTHTYTLVSGTGDADNTSFNINDNSLRITDSPDFETKNSYTVRIRTTDQGGLTYEEAFTITITEENEAPTDIALSASTIAENTDPNAVVGTLSSTDPDAANTVTYTFASGAGDTDNASFNISGTSLQITNSPDFEAKNSYSIRIRATDQGDLTYDEIFTITITNVNEAPVDIALSASSVNETVTPNTTVATLSTTDPDAGDTFTYTLVSGDGSADNASFTITGDELLITTQPDFDVASSYALRIRTTDQEGLFFEEAFVMEVIEGSDEIQDIPNALFPNGSAQNKTWGVAHLGITEEVEINVFDSNGRVVFSTDNPQQEWDGTRNGKQVPEDVYFYSIELSSGAKFQGSLQVIY
jgi:gliding motility-associated-like protein